jgi:hypothetical protein
MPPALDGAAAVPFGSARPETDIEAARGLVPAAPVIG